LTWQYTYVSPAVFWLQCGKAWGPMLQRIALLNEFILKKRNWRNIKDLAYFSSLGLQVALSIFIGYGAGRYLDAKLDTQPWMTIIFFIFGLAAAFRNIGLAIKKLRNY
jgi:ATP synthase protein I